MCLDTRAFFVFLIHILADKRIEGRNHNGLLLQGLKAEEEEQNLFRQIQNGDDDVDDIRDYGDIEIPVKHAENIVDEAHNVGNEVHEGGEHREGQHQNDALYGHALQPRVILDQQDVACQQDGHGVASEEASEEEDGTEKAYRDAESGFLHDQISFDG